MQLCTTDLPENITCWLWRPRVRSLPQEQGLAFRGSLVLSRFAVTTLRIRFCWEWIDEFLFRGRIEKMVIPSLLRRQLQAETGSRPTMGMVDHHQQVWVNQVQPWVGKRPQAVQANPQPQSGWPPPHLPGWPPPLPPPTTTRPPCPPPPITRHRWQSGDWVKKQVRAKLGRRLKIHNLAIKVLSQS